MHPGRAVGQFHVSLIDSVGELMRQADRWNDLWRRSQSFRPTSRAEHLAIWARTFAATQRFSAIAVETDNRLLAALPFVSRRRWPLAEWQTPGNEWTTSGELLVDQAADGPRICDKLLRGLRSHRPGIVAIDGSILTSQTLQNLLQSAKFLGVTHVVRERFQVPLVDVDGNWSRYLCSRSRNHRRQLRMIGSRAERQGCVVLERHEHLQSGEVEPLLRECFSLEAASWKARAGTAVLQHPLAWEFFRDQACELALSGELAIATLRQRGELVAFEYGWQSRGVRAVLKIGYDETRADLSPGHLLRFRLLEELFAERTIGWIDYIGPMTQATSAWATHRYRVGRIVNAGGLLGRAALTAWQWKLSPAAEELDYRLPLGCPLPQGEQSVALAAIQAT